MGSFVRRQSLLLTVVWGGLAAAWTSSAAPGDLDITFGTRGKVITSIPANTSGVATALQPDGKVIVAAWVNSDVGLIRYNVDGSLDFGFGIGGAVVTDFGGSDAAWSLALQPDGKIVVVGTTYKTVSEFKSVSDVFMGRYHEDGRLDASFGNGGKVVTDVDDDDGARAVAIQPDGKIVVAGHLTLPDMPRAITVFRYHSNGTLDEAFGDAGIAMIPFGEERGQAHDVAIQSDGKIVVAGYVYPIEPGGVADFAVARYTSSGAIDETFGEQGISMTDFSDDASYLSDDNIHAMAIQTDGKIVVAGEASTWAQGGGSRVALARYNADGSLDVEFGVYGKVKTGAGRAADLALQQGGKIVMAAHAAGGFTAFCYHPDGVLDTKFGKGGKVVTSFGSEIHTSQALTLHPNGKIVIVGVSQTAAGGLACALARYHGLPTAPSQSLAVTTLAADSIGFDSVTLHGIVESKDGKDATTFFELGRSALYGTAIPGDPYSVDSSKLVRASLNGLLPHTTYHYRLIATNTHGLAEGARKTFTTANRAPVAVNDNVTALPGAVVLIWVCANDTDADGDGLTLASFAAPPASVGKVSKQGNSLVFAAASGFTGEASFSYVVKDAFGGSATGTVNLMLGSCELDPSAATIAAAGQTYDVMVTATGSWRASESLPWVTVGTPSGTGNGTVAIQVQANTGKSQRVGTVTIGGQTHTITQAAVLQRPALTALEVIPEGIVSGDYELLIPTTGLPVKYTITGAPPGLTLNANTAILGGKPTKPGVYNMAIKAANAAGAAPVSLNFTLVVRPLPDGVIGSFAGYIEPNLRLNDGLGSRVELTTTVTGAVSGKLFSGGSTLPFKGVLDAVAGDGSVTLLAPVSRKGGAFLALDLTIDGVARAVTGELLEKGGSGTTVSSWDNIWNRAMAR